jgi:hypothetical protein
VQSQTREVARNTPYVARTDGRQGLADASRGWPNLFRKRACVVMFVFIAWGAIASATRFAANEPPVDSKATAVTIASGTKINTAVQHEGLRRETDSKRTIVLRGKVDGPDGRPIAAARLYLDVDEWHDPVLLGTSEASGAYRLVVSEEALRRTVSPNFGYANCNAALIGAAQGLGPGWAELLAVNGGRMGDVKPEYVQDIHLVADFPIAGRVVDNAGKPIVGAAVAVDRMLNLADPRWKLMHPAIKAGNPNLMTREQTGTNNWFTPLYPTAWKTMIRCLAP